MNVLAFGPKICFVPRKGGVRKELMRIKHITFSIIGLSSDPLCSIEQLDVYQRCFMNSLQADNSAFGEMPSEHDIICDVSAHG